MKLTSAAAGPQRPHPAPYSLNDIGEINAENLKQHVYMLAGEIGERNIKRPEGLINAAHYISRQWQAMGYQIHTQGYHAHDIPCANLEITQRGISNPERVIVVAAHYDTIGGCPGANDNGSGLAVMIEMARAMRTLRLESTVRFVALVNEEPPFFGTEHMGSWIYAHQASRRGDDIQLAVILDTLGYYNHQPSSQLYPPLFGMAYPDRGDFVAFISNLRASRKASHFASAFGRSQKLPYQKVVAPQIIPGMNWNAQTPFSLHNYSSVMVTDTGPYRYPFYHSAKDTPEKLSYDQMALIAQGLVKAVATVADEILLTRQQYR